MAVTHGPTAQRCASLRLRPRRQWPAYRFERVADVMTEGHPWSFRLTVVAHTQETSPETALPLWRYDHGGNGPNPFVGGITIPAGFSGTTDIEMRGFCTGARAGEIDVHITALSAPPGDADGYLAAIISATVAALGLRFGDSLVPTGPIGYRDSTTFSVVSPALSIKVVREPAITSDAATDAIMSMLDPIAQDGWLTFERQRSLMSRAVRRFFRASSLPDYEDRFIDYWLVCELLTSHLSMGGKAAKIAAFLEPGDPPKAKALETTQVKPLYDLRSDLLHGSDRLVRVRQTDVHAMERLAEAVIRKALRIGSGDPAA